MKAKSVVHSVSRVLILCFKLVWLASMIITPLVGMWLSSSLAAYHNRSVLMCIGFGLLLFPVVPVLWDRFYLWRVGRRETERKHVLTGTDRLILRTLVLNILFIGSLLTIAPASAFRAISTRGDWMLDGYNGPISGAMRQVIFDLADSLEGRWSAGKSVYGESDAAPEPTPQDPSDDSEGTDTTGGTDTPQEVKDDVPAEVVTSHWPLKDEIDPTVSEMPESVQGSYQEVAQYIQSRFEDPFERTRALHDYIALRLTYDHETLAKIEASDYANLPSQEAEPVFAARTGVCEGYARLMRAMGAEAGLEVAYVVGSARFRMRDAEGSGHAWNAVKINGQWYLIDVTWDDGTLEKSGFTYRTTYLNTPPELFGVDHFPDDPSWQLRSPPLTVGEFMRQPDLSPEFALYDFTMIEPTRSQVTVTGKLHITVGNPRGAFLLARWKQKDSDVQGERCDVQHGDPVEITCDIKKDGEYLVILFGNDEEFGSFSEVAKQLVNKR